jgi:hypothetical protein
MNAVARWALARGKEPSTWAGIAGLVASMTFLPHASELAVLIPQIGAGLAAVASAVAIFLPERRQ